MELKTFKFKEGTVIAEVDECVDFNMGAGKITETGKFTASLVGGTAPGIKPMLVRDAKKKSEKIFTSKEAAFKAAFQIAVGLSYHPASKAKK